MSPLSFLLTDWAQKIQNDSAPEGAKKVPSKTSHMYPPLESNSHPLLKSVSILRNSAPNLCKEGASSDSLNIENQSPSVLNRKRRSKPTSVQAVDSPKKKTLRTSQKAAIPDVEVPQIGVLSHHLAQASEAPNSIPMTSTQSTVKLPDGWASDTEESELEFPSTDQIWSTPNASISICPLTTNEKTRLLVEGRDGRFINL